LVIAGDGPERDHIRARATAEAVGDRVHILGHVPDPAEVYAGVDLLLIASDREQLPRTLLEAMSCALPVVTTHVGDVARALPLEQGPFIVPLQGSETAGLLAQALGRLLSEPRLRGELGLVNRTRVKVEFDARTMRAAYRALYRGALTGRVSR
jgi:glycosyltransferase involved in cell wall biosynthesis